MNKPPLEHLRGIVFDLDGVVADTEDLHRQAYNLAFEERGLTTRWAESDYKTRFTMTGGKKLETLGVPDGIDPEEYRASLYASKRRHYIDLLNNSPLPPRPGVLSLIDEALSLGLKIGAASTCAKEGARSIIENALGKERASRFDTIKAGDDVANRKPNPDIYLLALEGLGLTARHCVAIEDSRHGMIAAKAAGLWTLVTPSQYTEGDDFSEADHLVADLDTGGIDPFFFDGRLAEVRG